LHLLLIEDNPDLVENISDFSGPRPQPRFRVQRLRGLGFALENDYDAVILDLMLPGLDGLEVCARLRAANRTVPVLMLTAATAWTTSSRLRQRR